MSKLFSWFKKNKSKELELIDVELDFFWEKLLSEKNGSVSKENLERITSLRLFDEIETTWTLEPLLFMPNLKQLRLTKSIAYGVDLEYFSKFKNLKELNIATCDVSNIESLKEFNHLEILNISYIDLKTETLKCLNNFAKLHSLNVAGTGLRSMKIFQNNSDIKNLICSYSRGIKNMPNLEYLYLLLKDEVDIQNCPNLKSLRIGSARKMKDLSNLSNLTSLVKLEINIPYNEINLSSLHKLTSLKELYIDPKLDFASIQEPMLNVSRLTITDGNRSLLINLDSAIKKFFPNAIIHKFEMEELFFWN